MNSLIVPPTFAELLKDPIYRSYVLKAPRLPGNSTNPWRVWGIRHDDKWAGKLFPTYSEAFGLVKKMLKDTDTYRDVVLTCRPVAFRQPLGLSHSDDWAWCGHCRRPTVYRRMTRHVAMKKWAVVDYDPDLKRCFFCAARAGNEAWNR